MHKGMPWFKWYPTDADSDEHFRLMEDADIGFYIRCLNHAWVNGGIPADAGERARALRTRRDTADRRWIRVAPCFRPAEELGVNVSAPGTILCNPRQEVERKLASHLSEVRAESAKAKSKSKAIGAIRASDSVSCASLVLSSGGVRGGDISAPREPILPSERFEEWLRPWEQASDIEGAARVWIMVVNSPEDEEAVFSARDRYLASDQVAHGVWKEPAKWLDEQGHCGFSGRWPVKKSAKSTPYDSLMARYAEESKNGTKH